MAILGLAIACQQANKPTDTDKSRILTDQLDSIVTVQHKSGMFSGSVLVFDDGEIVLDKNYGYQNLDSIQMIDQQSVFEIASLSKQFTANLVMQLEEQGKIDYDDNLITYFPKLPYENITIRHLLTHTSGLSERQFFMWAGSNMDPTKIYSNDFILEYLENEQPELSFQPGESWEYSNLGYFLLPLIIEQTTGKHYIEFMEEQIIDPLGMENTGIYSQKYKGEEMENYVFGKVFNPKDSIFISSFGMAWSDSLYGGVGILSSTADLLKWDRALYTDQLVSQEALMEAYEPFRFSNDSSSQYGFGWYVRENYMINGKNCGKRLDHNGLWPGYESSIVRYIDKDKAIIILANQAPSAKDQLVEELSAILFSSLDSDKG